MVANALKIRPANGRIESSNLEYQGRNTTFLNRMPGSDFREQGRKGKNISRLVSPSSATRLNPKTSKKQGVVARDSTSSQRPPTARPQALFPKIQSMRKTAFTPPLPQTRNPPFPQKPPMPLFEGGFPAPPPCCLCSPSCPCS